MTPPTLHLREILRRVGDAEVRFVLVGGLAVNAWGYLRATRDVDLVPDPSSENLARLDALLSELGGKVDVGGKLLTGEAISTFLRTGDRTLVVTELGEVDVLRAGGRCHRGRSRRPADLGLFARAPDGDEAGQRSAA